MIFFCIPSAYAQQDQHIQYTIETLQSSLDDFIDVMTQLDKYNTTHDIQVYTNNIVLKSSLLKKDNAISITDSMSGGLYIGFKEITYNGSIGSDAQINNDIYQKFNHKKYPWFNRTIEVTDVSVQEGYNEDYSNNPAKKVLVVSMIIKVTYSSLGSFSKTSLKDEALQTIK